MPTQSFDIYTARGYAGDLVDSGPRVIQTGVLTAHASNASGVEFGDAVQRDVTTLPAGPRNIRIGGTEDGTSDLVNVFAIAQRQYNHEASLRPSDGTTVYKVGESVSLIRQGYLYIDVDASTNAGVAGDAVNLVLATGKFTTDTANGTTIVVCKNVSLDEPFAATGDVLAKIRIDIVR